jgi:hypothetical protein
LPWLARPAVSAAPTTLAPEARLRTASGELARVLTSSPGRSVCTTPWRTRTTWRPPREARRRGRCGLRIHVSLGDVVDAGVHGEDLEEREDEGGGGVLGLGLADGDEAGLEHSLPVRRGRAEAVRHNHDGRGDGAAREGVRHDVVGGEEGGRGGRGGRDRGPDRGLQSRPSTHPAGAAAAIPAATVWPTGRRRWGWGWGPAGWAATAAIAATATAGSGSATCMSPAPATTPGGWTAAAGALGAGGTTTGPRGKPSAKSPASSRRARRGERASCSPPAPWGGGSAMWGWRGRRGSGKRRGDGGRTVENVCAC